jgi:hypothetical protein
MSQTEEKIELDEGAATDILRYACAYVANPNVMEHKILKDAKHTTHLEWDTAVVKLNAKWNRIILGILESGDRPNSQIGLEQNCVTGKLLNAYEQVSRLEYAGGKVVAVVKGEQVLLTPIDILKALFVHITLSIHHHSN